MNDFIPIDNVIYGDELDMHAPQPRLQWVRITPEVAAEWLKRNEHNRPMSEVTIARYEADIRAGAWDTTSATIAFDTSGRLIDGQHRLTGMTRVASAEVIFPVVTGLAPEAQRRIDRGRTRQHGQQLTLEGQPYGSAVSAAVRVRITWDEGFLFRDRTARSAISDARLDSWIAGHPEQVKFIVEMTPIVKQIPAAPRLLAAAGSRFAELDRGAAVKYLTDLRDGGLALGDPVNTLRDRLHRIRLEGKQLPDRDYLAFFVQAWNLRRSSRQMVRFQRPRGGSWTADNFPNPR